jgi:hypothetical protein
MMVQYVQKKYSTVSGMWRNKPMKESTKETIKVALILIGLIIVSGLFGTQDFANRYL